MGLKKHMKPPKDPLAGALRKEKQMRPKGHDETLATYTTPLRTKYTGIEGVTPRFLSQQQSIGTHDAFAPHRRSLPIKSVSTDPNLHPTMFGGARPMHDRSIMAARPFTGLEPLGFERQPRLNKGNVDFTQKPLLIYSFS